ncbi:MAG: DUF202 domain-containing protein [Actinomycetaceae bacterium]|nr:DUF202 domain-containing protein [Actinomycetaceae bacterium]
MSAKPRFPAAVYERGSEPDQRFTLANERTFLAWVRTGIALMGAGVGLEVLNATLSHGAHMASTHIYSVVSAILIIIGIACPINAWFSWRRTEICLRENTPLPSSFMSLPLVIAVVVVGVLLGVGLML